MKKWICDNCRCDIETHDDYEPEYCCSGHMCGCQGEPINPIFCSSCAEKIFGSTVDYESETLN